MNDRLKDLMAKANFGNMENGEVTYDPRLEVFAKLLINECCKMMVKLEPKYNATLTGKQIERFYGVEE